MVDHRIIAYECQPKQVNLLKGNISGCYPSLGAKNYVGLTFLLHEGFSHQPPYYNLIRPDQRTPDVFFYQSSLHMYKASTDSYRIELIVYRARQRRVTL